MKRRHITIYIVLALLFIAGIIDYVVYRDTYQAVSFNTETFATDYSNITDEDVKPIPIPAEAIKQGRVLNVPILMYHHVGNTPEKSDPLRHDLTVPASEFETQMKWLKEHGYQTVRLEDVLLYSQGTTKIKWPKKPVVLTFDDGYSDVFTEAIPVMKKYNFTGSFGIITQWQGNTFGTNEYATWQQIQQAKNDGMEIICHTQNHFDGSNKKFSADYIFQNLTGCQHDITQHLGKAKPILIYPYGHYTPEYIEQAKKAGFEMSLTVHYGHSVNLNNMMEIPRVRIHPGEEMGKFGNLIGTRE